MEDIKWMFGQTAFLGLRKVRTIYEGDSIQEGWVVAFMLNGHPCEIPAQFTIGQACKLARQRLTDG